MDWLLGIGGITLRTGMALGRDLTLDDLRAGHDAVFLGLGLGGVNALGVEGDHREGVLDAVGFIADLRQAEDLSRLSVGRDVVVIGGGMTAIDVAVQAKLLGALNVTVVYRRSQARMGASRFEQDLAQSKGVRILCNAVPVAVHGNGAVREVEFEFADDALQPTGTRIRLAADQVFRAIGQTLTGDGLPDLTGGRIAVDGQGRSSLPGVWAGGDCASGGTDLTVTAVAQGRDAADAIHTSLMG